MRSIIYLVGLLSLVAPIAHTTTTTSSGLTVFEKLGSIPRGWQRGDAVSASKTLHFRIAVKQENAYDFEQHVIDISTPGHPKYGQHMSHQELKRALRPSSDATEAIIGWLKDEGVVSKSIEDDGDWINFYVTAAEAERIMDTKSVAFYDFNDGFVMLRIF